MKTLLISIKIFLFFTLLTGIAYPLFITVVAQIIYPSKANGSFIIKDEKIIGSSLIGQQFDSAIYFSSRPSSISYNPEPSGGSNFGLTNTKLKLLVNERKKQFCTVNLLDSLSEIPSEMLFASASGLDPHISPKAALMQIERVTEARKFNWNQKEGVLKLITDLTEPPQYSILGEERINVLDLNLELNKFENLSSNTK